MKVLLLTPSYFPIVGGTERLVENLATKLNEIGIRADVMTFNMTKKYVPSWREEIKELNFKVFRVPAFNAFKNMEHNPLEILFKANVVPKLNFTTILKDYDILHFHDDVDFTFPLCSWFIKRPKLFQCHTLAGTYSRFRKNPIHRAILKRTGNYYLTVSSFSRELLMALNVSASRIFILPNGVDLKRYDYGKSAKTKNLVLFAGRIVRPKGLHVLLESLNYLTSPVSLKIAGPNEDTSYFKDILGSGNLQKRGLHDVEWLGCLDQDKIVDWYQRASIFVNPSIRDDFGIVNLEALACGTPVVASNSGGVMDVVKDGVNGILVPPNNPMKLAIALQRLLENEKLREKYGENGRRLVEAHFSWDMIARKAARIYEKAVVTDTSDGGE